MSNVSGKLRQARIADVEALHSLYAGPAEQGEILPRTRMDLYGYLRDFVVYDDGQDRVVGAAGLHICWEDLGEIRSLVVEEAWRRRGLGRRLVEACLEEASRLGLRRVFVLTYRPDFFGRLGFEEVDKGVLPQKVWFDCVRCVKFPQCDEVAMIRRLDE